MKVQRIRKSTLAIACTVATIIVLFVLAMNFVLANSANAQDNVVASSETLNVSDTLISEIQGHEHLNIIVDYYGYELPEDMLSPQLIAMAASEASERIFGKPFVNRVFMSLHFIDGSERGSSIPANETQWIWVISAEVDNGTTFGNITSKEGFADELFYSANHGDWEYFDSYDAEAAERERIEAKRRAEEYEEQQSGKYYEYYSDRGGYISTEPFSEEDKESYRQQELQLQQKIEQYAEKMKDHPINAYAIELVNTLNMGNGAKAVSSKLVEGWTANTSSYEDFNPEECHIEIMLDNNRYLYLIMLADQTLLGFRSHYAPYSETKGIC